MYDSENKKMLHREPAFAGRFYPETKIRLNEELKKLFSAAKQIQTTEKQPIALISPHAGYIFSGRVAASAFNQIPENTVYKRVFVLASSHQFSFDGAAAYNSGNYITPLGKIEVDKKLGSELIKSNDIFTAFPEAHKLEHSLEVQLPFLQYKLNNSFLLVPIIIGTNNPADCKIIAESLKPYFNNENLFIISTDFSHYPDYDNAINNDLDTANAVCSNNPDKLLKVLETNKKKKITGLSTSLCGWTSVLTLLYLTNEKNIEFQKTDYLNSGDNEYYGDKDRVVGYWAITVYENSQPFSISVDEQKELLEKAHSAIVKYLETGWRGNPEPPKSDGILNKNMGVFISIYINGKLRGCIGSFQTNNNLNDLVQYNAVSAVNDSRFENPGTEELKNIEIEISVLTPLKKIFSPEKIIPGKHGIFIKKGSKSGTFLPQVATKTGWDTQELLGRCSRDKAGLGWDGWKKAELFIYEAFVFRG